MLFVERFDLKHSISVSSTILTYQNKYTLFIYLLMLNYLFTVIYFVCFICLFYLF